MEDFFEGGGNEFLADLSEFLYDDLGVITGEILAGSKKMANFIKPFTKLLPGPVGAALTGYDLWGLLTRTALYSTAGEIAQEGVQEFRGINEQSFGEILDSAAFKGLGSYWWYNGYGTGNKKIWRYFFWKRYFKKE